MKFFLAVCLLLLTTISNSAFSQTPTLIEVVDAYYNKVKPLFGSKSSMFRTALVKTTDTTGKADMVVTIEVTEESAEAIATSTSWSVGTSGWLNFGSGTVAKTVRNKGQRTLNPTEFLRFFSYLNRLYRFTGDARPAIETIWRFDMDESFNLALAYRLSGAPFTWVISIDGATFELDTASGVAFLRKMGNFRDALKK